ncbi:unnamed protein product [Brachionus calyciflorus]|uniref:Sorting nexin-3 n=1 Tax=Brachionus calyciflorus TaxID=104777 RepID=A0A813Y5A0_9BILA|nr:unnamed protein product [Brachionus calyciflorus]
MSSNQNLSGETYGNTSRNSSILIEISDPQNHGVGTKKYTDYLVKTKTTLPIFSSKEFSVRRRFSDFEFLKNKLEQNLKIKPPHLPDKAWKRQIPFMKETLFDEAFLEDRRKALDQFINNVSEHPLVQTEKLWVSFLQDDEFNKN